MNIYIYTKHTLILLRYNNAIHHYGLNLMGVSQNVPPSANRRIDLRRPSSGPSFTRRACLGSVSQEEMEYPLA